MGCEALADSWARWRDNADIPASRLSHEQGYHDGAVPERRPAREDLLQADMFHSLASNLRGWAQAIVRGADGAVSGEVERLLVTFITWLDGCAREVSGENLATYHWQRSKGNGKGGHYNKHTLSHGGYADDFLCSCLIFSFHLKGATSSAPLKLVLSRAFRCASPTLRMCADRMLCRALVPSPATLVRARFYCDVAWMCILAEKHKLLIENGGILFGLLDSSPQGGRNWLVSEYTCLNPGVFEQAAEAFEGLVALADLLRRNFDDTDAILCMRQGRQTLSNCFSRHILPPVGLGSHHTDTLHKAHSWMHQHRLENSSWATTQKLIERYWTIAVDGGPESHINEILVPARRLFPYWQDCGREGACDALDDLRDSADDTTLDTTHIVMVPGTYHWINNIQKRLSAQMPLFELIRPLLESACYIMHHAYTRNHFKNSLRGHRASWKEHFESGPKLFEGGREWGVLVTICAWFDERRRMITDAWPGYIAGGDSASDSDVADLRDREKGTHLTRATEAFESDRFWGMVIVQAAFSTYLAHINNWMMACPCHPSQDICEKAGIVHERSSCPMRGRRLPEVACHGLEKYIVSAGDIVSGEVAAALAGCPDSVYVEIMEQFRIGLRFITAEVRLRVQAHYDLPVKAFAIGHPESARARAGMAAAMAKFDRGMHGADHQWCRHLFSNAGLRASVLAVIHGSEWAEHPELLRERRKAFFASSSEVAVERDHAVVHQYILGAHNHTEAYVSCMLRKHEFVDFVETSSQNLDSYVGCLSKLRSSKSIASFLGLLGHAHIEDPDHVSLQEVREVVYRSDARTQYASLPDFLAPRPPPPAPPAPPPGGPPRGPSGGASGGPPPADGPPPPPPPPPPPGGPPRGSSGGAAGGPPPADGSGLGHSFGAGSGGGGGGGDDGDYEDTFLFASHCSLEDLCIRNVRKKLVVQHFLKHATAEDIFHLRSVRHKPLDDIVKPKLDVPDWLDVGALSANSIDFALLAEEFDFGTQSFSLDEVDELEDKEPADRTAVPCRARNVQGDIFFSITHKFPKKVLATLDTSWIIASVLPVRCFDAGPNLYCLHTEGGTTGDVLTWHDIEKNVDSLCYCRQFGTAYTTLVPVPGCNAAAASDALGTLYKAGALPGLEGGRTFDADVASDARIPSLRALQAAGYVETAGSAAVSSWRITEAGQDLITTSPIYAIGDTVPKLRHDIPLEQMTELELWDVLVKRGWSPRVWFKTRAFRVHPGFAPPPVCQETGKPKEFWIQEGAKEISRHYLLALLRIDEVRVAMLLHFKGPAYYKDALKAQRRDVWCNDVDELGDFAKASATNKKTRRPRAHRPAGKAENTKPNIPWGSGFLTWKENGKMWQATCPRCYAGHQNLANPDTLCRQARKIRVPGKCRATTMDEETTVRALKHWMNSCTLYGDRLAHQRYKPEAADLPTEEEVKKGRLPEDYNSDDDPHVVRGSKAVSRKRVPGERVRAGVARAAAPEHSQSARSSADAAPKPVDRSSDSSSTSTDSNSSDSSDSSSSD